MASQKLGLGFFTGIINLPDESSDREIDEEQEVVPVTEGKLDTPGVSGTHEGPTTKDAESSNPGITNEYSQTKSLSSMKKESTFENSI
jgi:hypothetical protein